jgi:hypothetical protein
VIQKEVGLDKELYLMLTEVIFYVKKKKVLISITCVSTEKYFSAVEEEII